jgi:hypothetical protein
VSAPSFVAGIWFLAPQVLHRMSPSASDIDDGPDLRDRRRA